MKLNKLSWILLITLLLVLAAIPKLLSTKGKNASAMPGTSSIADKKGPAVSAGKPKRAGKPVTVSTSVTTLSSINDIVVVNGTIRASKDIELRAEISGRVTKVYFTEGDVVKKGQLLLKINDDDFKAQQSKAQAAFNLAEARATRQKSLFEKEVISIEEFQASTKELESARADVQYLQAQLAKTTITAAFTGVIGITDIEEGSYVNTGTKIANLVAISDPEINFNIPEKNLFTIKKGQQVSYTITGLPDTFTASITAIEPKIDETTRTVAVQALCSKPRVNIPIGAFAKVTISTSNREGILIPSEALASEAGGFKAYTIKENQAVPIAVQTGFRNENQVEIISGLNAGDTIITSGVFLLRPGVKVEVRKSTKEEQQ
jgi:membrane fusion protein (multidrug efflux system)